MADCRRLVRSANLLTTGAAVLAFTLPAAAQTQPAARMLIGDVQTCGTCRVQSTPIVDVRDAEHLSRPNRASLLVDGRGQVYLQNMQTKQFHVYDPRGKWLGLIGGVGGGPGEFIATISAKVDPFDSLWVADPTQRRVSVFAPGSRALVRDDRVEAQISLNGGEWLLVDLGQLIVSLPYAPKSEDRLDQPGATGRVMKKFGPEAEARVRSSTMAPARDGKYFWRVRVTGSSYVIEKWTKAGALVKLVERAANWWTQPLGDFPFAFYRLLEILDVGAGKLVHSDTSQASQYAVVTSDIVFCGGREDNDGFPIWSLCKLALVK